MLDRLDPGFTILDDTDWYLEFIGDDDACDLLTTTAKAITSPLLITAIDASLDDESSSQTIIRISQEAGEPIAYKAYIQEGKNADASLDGKAPSLAEAIALLNNWLMQRGEPSIKQ